ncbi:g2323 [Coccomyxa elongata]
MSGGAVSHEEEVKQMGFWKNVTFAAIPLCIGVAIWDLSHAHAHDHEQIQYPYMHIRSKDFPWGPCSLFDTHCWEEQKEGHGEEE